MGWKYYRIGISITTNGDNLQEKNIPKDITTNDISYFKYAPVTSVNVERSYSVYKTLLSDQWHSFLFQNIKQRIIVQ